MLRAVSIDIAIPIPIPIVKGFDTVLTVNKKTQNSLFSLH